MKYLKLFKTEKDRTDFETNEGIVIPSIHFTRETRSVNYHPLPYDPTNGYEYVDLGLPSGLKWARCNIGAEKESDYGLYFAWGETVGYSEGDVENGIHGFYPEDYKFENGDTCDGKYTKYDLSDNLTTLEPSDDAATVNMGGSWRMPSEEEYEELLNNTTNTWTAVNGVNGRLFTGNNGNTLFLPASGVCYEGNVYEVGSGGRYWSSSLYSSSTYGAYDLSFSSNYCSMGISTRYHGSVVRGVMD